MFFFFCFVLLNTNHSNQTKFPIKRELTDANITEIPPKKKRKTLSQQSSSNTKNNTRTTSSHTFNQGTKRQITSITSNTSISDTNLNQDPNESPLYVHSYQL